MVQWVLKSNGQIVPRQTMRKLTADKLVRESEVKKHADLTDAINKKYGDSLSLPDSSIPKPKDANGTYYLTFDEVAPKVPDADIVDDKGTPIHPTSMEDILMNAEVLLPQGKDLRLTKVIWQSVDLDGKVIGNYNEIPVLSIILYNVELPDGTV